MSIPIVSNILLAMTIEETYFECLLNFPVSLNYHVSMSKVGMW